jgi:hypothetical protein
MSEASLTCALRARRQKLFNNCDWNGIDFVEVSADQVSLCLHFFGGLPKQIHPTDKSIKGGRHASDIRNILPANVLIEGGRRVTDIRVIDVRPEPAHDSDLDDCLKVTLDKPGDFSVYKLRLVERGGKPLDGFDPRYACIEFSFKLDCASELDCKTHSDCPPESFAAPDINYLAKDFASFRQLIYDRLSVTLPGWSERHAPDLGVTLVEILAYAADHLSYYQDAVATEAYLETARLRTSVRRHLRLIDYNLHDGVNARALVTVWVSADVTIQDPGTFHFVTGFDGIEASGGGIADEAQLAAQADGAFEVFEPIVACPPGPVVFRAAHSNIRFYTWGDEECCLAKGATRAALLDEGAPGEDGVQRSLKLKPGDILIFEEVLGPESGSPSDADLSRRHAVRLTNCVKSKDKLLGKLVLEVEWSQEDALPFSLCLSARRGPPDCDWLRDISVARGNVILVTHGKTASEFLGPVDEDLVLAECACEGSVIESSVIAKKFAPQLRYGPLLFSDPVSRDGPVTQVFVRDPSVATPEICLVDKQSGESWTPISSLMDTSGESLSFVAECSDDGLARLRFGDGMFGRKPDAGARFTAKYRVGKSERGNVGCDTISYIVLKNLFLNRVTIIPRNPLAAAGGAAPQSVEEARIIAPGLLKSRRQRAVTAQDYAEIAARNAKLQGAAASLRWTGSWREASVSIDPLRSEAPTPGLVAEVEGELSVYRRMGHDLSVGAARYVPIDLKIEVCVVPHHARADVLRALRKTFAASSSGGYFNPDNLVFGGSVRLSPIVAAAQAVEGVQTVKVTKLERLGFPDPAVVGSGILKLGAEEIAQLANDPDFPEHGRITLTLRGGR